MGIVADRLRFAMELRKMKQTDLVQRTGIGKSSISTYLSGEYEPKQINTYKLAEALDVNPSWLLGNNVPMELDKSKPEYHDTLYVSMPIRVPVLGAIPAGIPLEAIQDPEGWEEIPSDMARGGKEYFGLKVKGDSMSPVYLDGDVLIFRVQDSCESGQDCAVIVNGGEATFKRVRITPSGVALHPLNPNYETLFFTNSEVSELPVRILGVVVELRRKI